MSGARPTPLSDHIPLERRCALQRRRCAQSRSSIRIFFLDPRNIVHRIDPLLAETTRGAKISRHHSRTKNGLPYEDVISYAKEASFSRDANNLVVLTLWVERRLWSNGWLGREGSNLRMAESKSAASPLGSASGTGLLEIERNAHARARYAQHEAVLAPRCRQHLVAVQDHAVAIAALARTAEPHFAG